MKRRSVQLRVVSISLVLGAMACGNDPGPAALDGSLVSSNTQERSEQDLDVVPAVEPTDVDPLATDVDPVATDVDPLATADTVVDDSAVSAAESGAPTLAAPVTAVVPDDAAGEGRFPGLARVGNLAMWFTLFWEVDNPAGDPNYMPDAELARLVAHGFTGVRLPIDPNLIADQNGTLNSAAVDKVANAVDRMQSLGLAVVIDLHIWEPDDWESPEQVQRVEWIWKQLAPVFAGYDPALTFLELYNEPGWWGDQPAWAPYEQSIYDVVRAAAPLLPIVLSGPMSSWVDGLAYSLVVDDPNVLYTIHVYDPFPFTHQGADWGADPGLIAAVAIPFPATPEACGVAIAAQPSAESAAVVSEYCSHGYDESWVRDRIAQAAQWADEHGVELFLGEFGVSPTAGIEDAARWFATVANAAEEFGIGWSIWDIDSSMGIRRASRWQSNLSDPPDPQILAALGLLPA